MRSPRCAGPIRLVRRAATSADRGKEVRPGRQPRHRRRGHPLLDASVDRAPARQQRADDGSRHRHPLLHRTDPRGDPIAVKSATSASAPAGQPAPTPPAVRPVRRRRAPTERAQYVDTRAAGSSQGWCSSTCAAASVWASSSSCWPPSSSSAASQMSCRCSPCATLAMLLELLSRSHKVGCRAPFRPYSLTPGQRLEVEVVQSDGSGAPSTASISAS
jgi:hypothetical protein